MNPRYLLDTNAARHAITKKNPVFDRNLLQIPMADLLISTVTEGELRYGLARRRSRPLRSLVDTFLLGLTILPWDSAAAQRYGDLRAALERQGQLLGSLDMMIAAHALSLGLTLVSSDRAFKRIKQLKVEDWAR